MTDIEKAIEIMEHWKKGCYGKTQLAFETALSALHSEQERQKGCEYCKGLKHGGLADGYTPKELEIRSSICTGYFCPYCGRKLEVDK